MTYLQEIQRIAKWTCRLKIKTAQAKFEWAAISSSFYAKRTKPFRFFRFSIIRMSRKLCFLKHKKLSKKIQRHLSPKSIWSWLDKQRMLISSFFSVIQSDSRLSKSSQSLENSDYTQENPFSCQIKNRKYIICLYFYLYY